MKNCPNCAVPMVGVEYRCGAPEHYDGVSEWMCEFCGVRIGRWTGKRLAEGERERRDSRFADAPKE